MLPTALFPVTRSRSSSLSNSRSGGRKSTACSTFLSVATGAFLLIIEA
jgi:hypothetical protein